MELRSVSSHSQNVDTTRRAISGDNKPPDTTVTSSSTGSWCLCYCHGLVTSSHGPQKGHQTDTQGPERLICVWVSISAPGLSKYFLTNNDEGQTGPMLDQFFLRSGSQALQGSGALTGPGSKEKVVLHAKFHHSCNKSYPRTTCIVILTWSVG